MLTPLPKRFFIAAKDTGGSDDFYLYISTSFPSSYFSVVSNSYGWRQIYYRSGEATALIDDSNLILHQFNNVIIIQLVFSSVPDLSYISVDRGNSWNTFFTILPAGVIYGGEVETLIYASSSSRLYKTITRGASWSIVSAYPGGGLGGTPVSIHIFGQNIVVAGDAGSILRSTNYGAAGSWTLINTGLASILKTLKVGNTIVSFDSIGNVASSQDQGATWGAVVPSPNPLKTFRDVDFSDDNKNHLFMTLDNELYVSTDLGDSWSLGGSITAGTNIDSIVHSSEHSLLAVSKTGLYFSANGYGESIDSISFDVGNPDIKPFAVRKVSPQTTEAFISGIAQSHTASAPITTLLKANSTLEA